MNTRRLTKKYKHKSRSKKSRKSKKTRRTRRSGRRVLKGGVIPRGVVVSRRSGASSASVRPSSVRPSDSARISEHRDNFNFEFFYNKLMTTHVGKLESTLQDNKDMYIKNTTFQTFQPKGAYPNMTGLKFVNYLHGKFNIERGERKNHLESIISQLDQTGMAPALRYKDLKIIRENITAEYFNLYKRLYNEIYKRLFRNGNHRNHPLSTSAIVFEKLPTVVESEGE